MTSPPDQQLPIISRSLQEFNCEAKAILYGPGDAFSRRSAFVRYCLAGIATQDDEDVRIKIDPMRDCVTSADHPFTVTRDFDSLIGITRNLPFTQPVAFYPVPPFCETMVDSNHMTVPITPIVSLLIISIQSHRV